MPVYNAERYVHQAIFSVISQDYTNWELLVVDDGSTDRSLSLVYGFNDSRISVLTQENRGVSCARNAALRVMKGSYFSFLDADDVLPPRSLSARLSCFHSDRICFVDGHVEIFNAEITVMERRWCPKPTDKHFRSLVRLDGDCFFGPTWMIRKLPGITYRFDETLTHGEELFFYMSYAHLGLYTFCNEVVLQYRRRPNSSMSNLTALASGYQKIGQGIKKLPSKSTRMDRMIYALRSRKVMFLSFLRSGNPSLAIKYLVSGTI